VKYVRNKVIFEVFGLKENKYIREVGLFSNFNNNIFKIKIILMIMFLSSE
jgi:hypothetical protein